MVYHKLARVRSKLSLLLLLALSVALLPVRHVSAEDQVVVIPKAEMQVSLWQSLWQRTKDENDRLPYKQVENLLVNELYMYKVDINIKNAIEQFRTEYRAAVGVGSSWSYEASVYKGLSTIAAIPELRFSLLHFGKTFLRPRNQDFPLIDAEARVEIASGTADFYQEELRRQEAEQTRRVVQKAKQDPQFATTYDQINQERLGASISELDDVGAFIRNHPEAAIPPALVQAVRADGSVAISLADLNELAQTEFGKINTSIDDLQRTVGEINAKQDVLLDYVRDERARQEAQALAEAKAQEHRLKLQVAQSTLTVVATLASYISPERGKQINVVGNAVLQVADAYTNWTKAVAGLGTFDALTSLSTAAMTGNVLNAVLNVVGLFAPAQPTPEQMILEQIGKLREQVSQLRTEMHDRFDRVDAQLNTIYSAMQDRFDKIDLRLGRIEGNVQEIQQSLVRLEQTLSRIERNSFEFLDAANRRPLLNAINGGLGYKQRTGLDMPYQPDFLQYENDFHSWGTIYAFDALSAGPTQRDYSDTAVLAELNAYPLDVNINYLNGWLLAHGLQPFATKRLPGPRDWLFASRAYAQLGLEWPEYAARVTPGRQAALDAVGQELEQAMRTISTMQTPTGLQGNDVLFDEVLANYTGFLGELDTALQATQASFVQQRASALGRTTLFDLYGGAEQRVNHTPADMATMTCGNAPGYEPLPAPSNLKNIVPDYDLSVLADYLAAKALKVCLGGQWMEPKLICSGSLCQTYAFHRAIISVYAGNNTVARRTIDMPEREVVNGQALVRTMAGWLQGPGYKRLFEEQFANATPSPSNQRDAILGAIKQELARLQQQFNERVRSEMATGGLRDTALKLAGSRKLVESFVALGMPQALANDDLLRSLLYSNQALIDDQQIVAAYAQPASAVASAATADLTTNPRLALIETANERYAAIGQLITRYTDAISADTYSEPISLVSTARMRMELVFMLVGLDDDGQRYVFLPLTNR